MFPALPHGCWKLSCWEPRRASEGLCRSRHVLQMGAGSLAGLSLGSGHFRAFIFFALALGRSALRLTRCFLLQSNIWK